MDPEARPVNRPHGSHLRTVIEFRAVARREEEEDSPPRADSDPPADPVIVSPPASGGVRAGVDVGTPRRDLMPFPRERMDGELLRECFFFFSLFVRCGIGA